jgi:hypothetical protein
MAAKINVQMQVSVQDGTTVTLVPTAVGAGSLARDLASPITQVVITMAARDTVVFDIVGRVFDVDLQRR